jgi:hypothetical protein
MACQFVNVVEMGHCAQCGGENEVCCNAALPGSGYSCAVGLACGIRTVIGEAESPFCYRCGGNEEICCDVGAACGPGLACDPTVKFMGNYGLGTCLVPVDAGVDG